MLRKFALDDAVSFAIATGRVQLNAQLADTSAMKKAPDSARGFFDWCGSLSIDDSQAVYFCRAFSSMDSVSSRVTPSSVSG